MVRHKKSFEYNSIGMVLWQKFSITLAWKRLVTGRYNAPSQISKDSPQGARTAIKIQGGCGDWMSINSSLLEFYLKWFCCYHAVGATPIIRINNSRRLETPHATMLRLARFCRGITRIVKKWKEILVFGWALPFLAENFNRLQLLPFALSQCFDDSPNWRSLSRNTEGARVYKIFCFVCCADHD